MAVRCTVTSDALVSMWVSSDTGILCARDLIDYIINLGQYPMLVGLLVLFGTENKSQYRPRFQDNCRRTTIR